jgi:DNA-binding response OmpR family regulator
MIRFGDVEVNQQAYEATKKGMRVALTSREFQLLSYFLNQRGKVLTREQIFDDVWGLDYTDIGSVTVTVKNLRDKIDPQNEYIKTVWGVGYKFVGTI